MKPFKHINARTANEAVKLLKDNGPKARLIAGGTDLLGALKDKILPEYPETIINIKTVRKLDYILEDSKGLKIGALARLEHIAHSPEVRGGYRLLADAAGSVASPQIRRMGTIGGNLCQDVRCWYYRYPDHMGGQIPCYLKGGNTCHALTGENRYHSVFGGLRAGNPPCVSACPGGVDIPSYLNEIREGNLHGAAGILLASNPMPSITGRVCPHFCQQQCNRRRYDETVSIRDIERSMGDYILEHANELITPPEKDSGKGVAIIGSGPAGLSAAFYLRRSGHRVTIFESLEEPGDMITNDIPDKRLPKDVSRRVVQAIEDMGVEFRLKIDITRDIGLNNLKKGFDGLLIACADDTGLPPDIQQAIEEIDGPITSRGPHRILKHIGKRTALIEAIASGKMAAMAMDQYLGGQEVKAEDSHEKSIAPFTTFNNNCLKKTSQTGRQKILEQALGPCLSEIQAEADRCLNCSCLSVNVSDIGVALVTLDARIRIAGPKGVRTIPIGEFFGAMRNSLAADEIVTEIRIPRPPEGARQIFLKYRLREAIDFAIVSLASVIAVKDGVCKEARIALGAVAPRPFRAIEAEKVIKGKAIDYTTAEAAAEAAVIKATPLNKNAYKVEIAKKLVKKAILS